MSSLTNKIVLLRTEYLFVLDEYRSSASYISHFRLDFHIINAIIVGGIIVEIYYSGAKILWMERSSNNKNSI